MKPLELFIIHLHIYVRMLAVATFLFLEQRMSVKAHQPSCYIRSLVLAVDPAVRTKTQRCQK